MDDIKIVRNTRFLKHHGILGMRWGHRNGPPYPLAPNKHSASERKAGWRKSLNKSPNEGYSIPNGGAGGGGSKIDDGDEPILNTLYKDFEEMGFTKEEALKILTGQNFGLTLAESVGIDADKLSKEQYDRLLQKAIRHYSKSELETATATGRYVKNEAELWSEKNKKPYKEITDDLEQTSKRIGKSPQEILKGDSFEVILAEFGGIDSEEIPKEQYESLKNAIYSKYGLNKSSNNKTVKLDDNTTSKIIDKLEKDNNEKSKMSKKIDDAKKWLNDVLNNEVSIKTSNEDDK